MEKISNYNSDGTMKTCPYGASVNYPVGTIDRVRVGSFTSELCPCFAARESSKKQIICTFPELAEKTEWL